jgi:hypothetical protein
MLPAKVPITVDENGQMLLFDVVYDHIHTMSADHAMMTFEQRDENLRRQKRAATRDLESFLDNNPNAQGYRERFLFEFSDDSESEQVVQKIPESGKKPKKPKPR